MTRKRVKKTAKKKAPRGKVDAYKHSTRRTKIPTEQSEAYMPDKDKEGVGYRQSVRAKGSAPTLNWDRELDANGFEVQAHPLYIHEKIHPASFIQFLGGGAVISRTAFGTTSTAFPKARPTNGTSTPEIGKTA